jgi:RNA recognition motif-containing protein
MNIYVGNINFKATEDQLKQLFESFGEVTSVKIITDYYSGRSKGFGFVEMPNSTEAMGAIEKLNDTEFLEKKIIVNQARPKSTNNNRGGNYGKGDYNRDRGNNFRNEF